MKIRFLFGALFALLCVSVSAQKTVSVSSPDGQTQVDITLSDRIYYDLTSHGEKLLQKSHIGMTLANATLGENPKLKSKKVQTVNEVVTPIHPLKASKVENHYTLLTLTLAGNYAVEWRVYNDGVAYRFVTKLKGDIEVMAEDATWQLADKSQLVLQQTGNFKTSCEELYSVVPSNEWKKADKMSELPVLIMGKNQKMLLSEFDLFDYPGTFLKGNADNSLSAVHPKNPKEYEDAGDRSQKILSEYDYIAKTTGTRTFPWRYLLITQDDRKIAENTMPMRLAPENAIGDTDWIKVGQTCWDWLNGMPYGQDVNFKSGINFDTYKYFVDFAARNGVKYMLMDEGWALDTRDPFKTNADVHLPELISYAASKGVGLILWLPWLTVEHHMDMFEVFEKWGIKGVKIDFMDRQDQWMINFYERVAKEAAKHHIFVDFHGAFHPSGLDYKYPNVLTYEGVRGMEYCGGCQPANTVWLPFLRGAVGPVDYTPGPMICYQPERYHGGRPTCGGVGTKAYNMAMFVLLESNLQMLMDNPCRYDMWPDCRDFLTGVPVNWDETKVLAAEAGQYCVTAKRNGNKWYIGGMTNGTKRDLTLDLSFLTAGKKYKMTSFEDGINADVLAMDYKRQERAVDSATKLKVTMVRNGGFAAVLEVE